MLNHLFQFWLWLLCLLLRSKLWHTAAVYHVVQTAEVMRIDAYVNMYSIHVHKCSQRRFTLWTCYNWLTLSKPSMIMRGTVTGMWWRTRSQVDNHWRNNKLPYCKNDIRINAQKWKARASARIVYCCWLHDAPASRWNLPSTSSTVALTGIELQDDSCACNQWRLPPIFCGKHL